MYRIKLSNTLFCDVVGNLNQIWWRFVLKQLYIHCSRQLRGKEHGLRVCFIGVSVFMLTLHALFLEQYQKSSL
jgi:hypothetical protein